MDQPPLKYKRIEQEKGRPHYLVWPPDGRLPVALHTRANAQLFLEKEGLSGTVPLSTFDFKKTPIVKELTRGKLTSPGSSQGSKAVTAAGLFDDEDDNMDGLGGGDDDGADAGGQQGASRSKFNLENLLRSNHDIDHKQLLEKAARLLEDVRFEYDLPDPDGAECDRLKLEIVRAPNVGAIVDLMSSSKLAMQKMTRAVGGRCLEEMMTLSSVAGPKPLSDWPIDMGQNWYSEVIKFAYLHSPAMLSFLLRLVAKDASTSLLPRHVLSLATIYAHLGKEIDKANNSLALMQGLSLKMDGLSDRGLAGQAKLDLSVTERTLRYKRDELAEVQANMLIEANKERPSQLTLDNCNTSHTDCIVAYSQAETEDTTGLSTNGLCPEDIMALFTPSALMLTSTDLKGEFDHLREVCMLAVGLELANHLPAEVGHWKKLLPENHSHPWSDLPLEKAKCTLLPPMPYQVQYLRLELVIDKFLRFCDVKYLGDRPQGHDRHVPRAADGQVESSAAGLPPE